MIWFKTIWKMTWIMIRINTRIMNRYMIRMLRMIWMFIWVLRNRITMIIICRKSDDIDSYDDIRSWGCGVWNWQYGVWVSGNILHLTRLLLFLRRTRVAPELRQQSRQSTRSIVLVFIVIAVFVIVFNIHRDITYDEHCDSGYEDSFGTWLNQLTKTKKYFEITVNENKNYTRTSMESYDNVQT